MMSRCGLSQQTPRKAGRPGSIATADLGLAGEPWAPPCCGILAQGGFCRLESTVGGPAAPATSPQLGMQVSQALGEFAGKQNCRAAGPPSGLNWAVPLGNQAGLASGLGSRPSRAFLQVSRPRRPTACLFWHGVSLGEEPEEGPHWSHSCPDHATLLVVGMPLPRRLPA